MRWVLRVVVWLICFVLLGTVLDAALTAAFGALALGAQMYRILSLVVYVVAAVIAGWIALHVGKQPS